MSVSAVVLSAAGKIANHLRRTKGRTIDIEWLLQNRRYALHVIELAEGAEDPMIRSYAQILLAALTRAPSQAPKAPV